MAKPVKLSSVCFEETMENVFKTSKAEFIIALLSLLFGLISAAFFPFATAEVINAAALENSTSVLAALLLAVAFAVSFPLFTVSFILSLKRLVGKSFPTFAQCCLKKLYLTEGGNIDAVAAENQTNKLERLFFTVIASGGALLLCAVLAIVCSSMNGLALAAFPIVILTFIFALITAKGRSSSNLVPIYSVACFAAWGITLFTTVSNMDELFKVFVLLSELTASSAVFLAMFKRLCELYGETADIRYILGLNIRDEQLPPINGDIRLYDVSIGVSNIIDGLNAHFEADKVTAVLGGSGSGKSHLYRLLKGELRCDKGYVMYDDSDIAVTNPALTAAFTASVSLKLKDGAIPLLLDYDKTAETQTEFEKRLRSYGLSELYQRYGEDVLKINDLSYEDKTKLAIAESRLTQPKVLLINSLLDNLNDTELAEVVNSLKNIGMTVIVFTSSERTAELCESTVRLINRHI